MQQFTETEIERIAGFLREGRTSTQIAMTFPTRSRGSIMGIIYRNPILKAIGLPARPNVWHNHAAHRSRAAKAERIKAPKPPKPPLVKAELVRVVCTPLEPRMVKLVDLERTDCRWPIGDPRSESFGFCGHARMEGWSYCEAHAKAAKQKPMPKTKRTLREAR